MVVPSRVVTVLLVRVMVMACPFGGWLETGRDGAAAASGSGHCRERHGPGL